MMYDTILHNIHPRFGLREALQTSVLVRADNVAELVYGDPREEWDLAKDFPRLIPPFPNTYIEYQLPPMVRGLPLVTRSKSPVRCAILASLMDVFKTKDTLGQVSIVAWSNRDDIPSGEAIDGVRMINLYLVFSIGLEGQPLLETFEIGTIEKYSEADNSIPPPMRERFLSIAGPGLFAINLMHCKNVKQIEHGGRRVPGQRNRHGPRIRYRTLEIEPMKKIILASPEYQAQGIRRALHIARGHFKDFSKGAGLFGKYQGLYWWEMQVRGSAEAGEVRKDYEIGNT